MLIARAFLGPPWPILFLLSAVGLLLSGEGPGASLPGFCGSLAGIMASSASPAAFSLVFQLNPPSWLLAGWALMLLAMMPPLLAGPLTHVWRSSLARRRHRALGLFVAGYAAAWMAAGPFLIALALALQVSAGESSGPLAVAAAILWTLTPWSRRALNRGHRLAPLALRGAGAASDAVRFGLVHGGWCIVSCWPWMMIPLVVLSWHSGLMVLVGALMLAQRLSPPSRPRWRLLLGGGRSRITPVATAGSIRG